MSLSYSLFESHFLYRHYARTLNVLMSCTSKCAGAFNPEGVQVHHYGKTSNQNKGVTASATRAIGKNVRDTPNVIFKYPGIGQNKKSFS